MTHVFVCLTFDCCGIKSFAVGSVRGVVWVLVEQTCCRSLSAAPLSRVRPLHSFLLLLNAAHTVRPLPLPPRSPSLSLSLSLALSLSLSLHPSSHLSLTLFHPSRVTPVPLTPPRSTQSTAFISFLLPFRAYFASLERRCAFYALSAPDPSSNPNREEPLELAECFPTL